ncbi:hypothetical protein ONZ45_g14355 [Pleurotus djamor]|nr:hypothetical protein ONZ45_g14355 [Pleurotus djamor]
MLRRQDRHFPQEIVDIIVENVQDPADWRRCALVHRSWTPASQRQIFRQIFLELCGSCGVKILRLRDILSASPCIAANVQELALYQEQHGYFEDEEEEGEDGNNDDEEENGTEMTRSQVLHGLSLVIKLIPQVQTISLCCGDIHGDRWLLDPKLMQLVQSFLERPAIKNIVLMEWLFPTLPSFYEFMDRAVAASLVSLTLHVDIDADDTSDSSSFAEPMPTSLSPKDDPPIILSSLDIDTDCQSFGAWIDSLSHPLVVQRLTLRGSSDVKLTPVLSRLSSGISELSLYDNDDHPSINLSGLGHISKITLCVPNEHQDLSRSFAENLLTLPRSNSIKSLVVQDEIFENPGSRSAFEFIDKFISSQRLPTSIGRPDISSTIVIPRVGYIPAYSYMAGYIHPQYSHPA